MWERHNINLTAGAIESRNKIFSAVLIGGLDKKNENDLKILERKQSTAKICLSRFIGNFPYNIFSDAFAIFYELFTTVQVEVFSVEQLRLILDTNRDLILNSPYVNKSAYASTENGNIASDDDIFVAISNDAVDALIELSHEIVTEEEFKSACVTYSAWFKNELATSTAHDMAAIMTDSGIDIKRKGNRVKHYQGIEDMMEYYNEQSKIIKSLSSDNRLSSFIVDEKWYTKSISEDKKDDLDSMFNIGIKEMDATIGYLRRGNMLGIMGPPKGGKTRFTNYLVNRALSLGYNVCVWPLEGTSAEWEAMQIACDIANETFNAVKTGKAEEMIRLSSKDILQRKYVQQKSINEAVNASKLRIATSESYGRLSFIEGTAYVEDFLDVLEAHYENENPFDVLVIDSLVNIMSKKGKGKVERISEAYMETKNFLANRLKRPALGIMPAQLKQDVVDFLRRNPDETIDVTAGGESAETVRTPDETIGLFSSKEERDNNIMKFYSVASRHNGSFQDFQARCYLECCYFVSQDE